MVPLYLLLEYKIVLKRLIKENKINTSKQTRVGKYTNKQKSKEKHRKYILMLTHTPSHIENP